MEHYQQIFGPKFNNSFNLQVLKELDKTNARLFFFHLLQDQVKHLVGIIDYNDKELNIFAKDGKAYYAKFTNKFLRKYNVKEAFNDNFTLKAVFPDESVLYEINVPNQYYSDVQHIIKGNYSKVKNLNSLYSRRAFANLVCEKNIDIKNFMNLLSERLNTDVLKENGANLDEVYYPFLKTDWEIC